MFLKSLFRTQLENEVPLRAAGISFFFFLSLLPILATFVSVVMVLPVAQVEAEQAFQLLTRWLLPDVIHEVEVHARAFAQHAGVVSLTSLLATLWLLTKIVYFLQSSMNSIWGIQTRRSFIKMAKKAAIIFVFSSLAVVLGISARGHGATSVLAELVGAWICFVGLNRLLPDRRVEWSWLLPGSLLGGGVWYAMKWGFSTYVRHFAKVDQLYAILGALPLFLLWMYASVMVLLLSACFNCVLAEGSGDLNRP